MGSTIASSCWRHWIRIPEALVAEKPKQSQNDCNIVTRWEVGYRVLLTNLTSSLTCQLSFGWLRQVPSGGFAEWSRISRFRTPVITFEKELRIAQDGSFFTSLPSEAHLSNGGAGARICFSVLPIGLSAS